MITNYRNIFRVLISISLVGFHINILLAPVGSGAGVLTHEPAFFFLLFCFLLPLLLFDKNFIQDSPYPIEMGNKTTPIDWVEDVCMLYGFIGTIDSILTYSVALSFVSLL